MALVVIPILYIYFYSENITLMAKILSLSLANWLIWHALADILAYAPVKGYIKQGYIVIAPRLQKSSSKSFVDSVSKVSTLIFYGFSLVTFIFSIINVNFTE